MVALLDRPVSLAELNHLATRRPDSETSGYKNVFRSTHGDGWRVRLKWRGQLRSLKGIFPSPREAAKALVRFYREHLGEDWTARIRPGFYIRPPKVPSRPRPWYVPSNYCGDPRKGARGWCPKLARLARPRRCVRPVEGDGYRIFEQAPGEWVITAHELGRTFYVDRPGQRGWFHSRESALVFLGMWQRSRWPWLGLRILGETRPVPYFPTRSTKPRNIFPVGPLPTRRPPWRRLPEVWRVTPTLPFPAA